jgi:predicted transposase YbfD/YdcC
MDVDARACLMRYFEQVTDPRARNVSHRLADMLAITLMAVMSRCDDWEEIADWGKAHEPWLKTFLALPHGIPSHDTFDRLFARLDPVELERCFVAFTAAAAKASGGRLIAIDGKTLRRSFDAGGGKAAIHMVSAWCQASELVLGQLATEEKSNEITAIPALLALIDVKGAVVSIDAMGCQKAIAQKILDGKGDYLLAVKDNHKTLHEDVRLYMDEAIKARWAGMEHDEHRHTDADHGRLEKRRCWVTHQVGWLKRLGHDWPQLRGLVCVESDRQVFGGKRSVERRYYLTSLDPRKIGAEDLLDHTRGHWQIENKLHWCLDVSFREDDSRVRKGHGAQNLSRMRRWAMNLLRPMPALNERPDKPARKVSLKVKRLMCSWDRDYLLKALNGQR